MVLLTEFMINSFIHVENLRLPKNQTPKNYEKHNLSKMAISPSFLNEIKKFKMIWKVDFKGKTHFEGLARFTIEKEQFILEND